MSTRGMLHLGSVCDVLLSGLFFHRGEGKTGRLGGGLYS